MKVFAPDSVEYNLILIGSSVKLSSAVSVLLREEAAKYPAWVPSVGTTANPLVDCFIFVPFFMVLSSRPFLLQERGREKSLSPAPQDSTTECQLVSALTSRPAY